MALESGDCRSYCINLSSFSFILAISNNPHDILCPIYIEDGSECYNHSRCNGFNEAFQSPFFSICKNPDNSSLIQMCFTNITEAHDGIKMFFITADRINCCSNVFLSTSSNLYFRAVELQVDGKMQQIISIIITFLHGVIIIIYFSKWLTDNSFIMHSLLWWIYARTKRYYSNRRAKRFTDTMHNM